jgi:hypothetical protein
MRIHTVLTALSATTVLLAGACAETTAPGARFAVAIDGINVPSVAAPSDTVVVSFRYDASCGEREVTLRFKPESLVVAATGAYPPGGLVCPALVAYAYRSVTLLPAERPQPFTVIFRQPSGGDSVRTIQTALASMDAP